MQPADSLPDLPLMSALGAFHFLRPEWFWAVLPLLVILGLWFRQRMQRGSWNSCCDDELMPYILEEGVHGQPRWPLLLFTFAALLGIVALAGPAWQRLPVPVYRNESALVVVLDLSRSMDATDLKPARLKRARFKVADILKRRGDGMTAMVVYGADAFTVAPLTDDAATILNQLNALETGIIPQQGSSASLALKRAAELLQQAGVKNGAVLLITDGVDASAESVAAELKSTGHRLFVLGAGTPDGAPIPAPGGGFIKDRSGNIVVSRLQQGPLRQLAAQGGGFYRKLAADQSDIDALRATIEHVEQVDGDSERMAETDQWVDQGPWLVLLILPFAALAFRQGYLPVLVCVLVTAPQPARALDWEGLWLTPDQQAFRAFNRGDTDTARKLFENPDWKAAAEYASGDYDRALESLQGKTSGNAAYNRGNSLARMGRFQEALEQYNEVLETDPQHEDALHNRELIEQLMQQQSQQDSGEGDSAGKPGDQSNESGEQTGSDSGGQEPGESEDQAEGSDSGNSESDSATEDNAEKSSAADAKASRHGDSESDAADETEASDATGDSEEHRDPGSLSEQNPDDEASSAQHGSTTPESSGSEAPVDPEHQSRVENQQARELWLRRIPDNPGGLLRRKFKYQYGKRNAQRAPVDQAW